MTTLLTELTSGPLAQELAFDLASGNDGAVLQVLQRKDIPAKGSVTSHDIKAYMFAYGFWNAIKHGASVACEDTIDALTLFDSFDLSNPVYLSRLTQILDALVIEPLVPDFQETNKLAILALGDTLVSRAEQLDINVTVQDIAQVRELI